MDKPTQIFDMESAKVVVNSDTFEPRVKFVGTFSFETTQNLRAHCKDSTEYYAEVGRMFEQAIKGAAEQFIKDMDD